MEIEKEEKFPDLDEDAAAPIEVSGVPESKILILAGWVLAVLALIFVLSGAFYVYNEQSKMVFDSVKEIIPPIVTLILGYYFSKK